MKVTFRDLKQQKFVIDVEPTDLVYRTLQEELMLRFLRKILKDDDTVSDYHIEEKGFVVCMVNKPKEKPIPAAESSSAAAPATPAQSSSRNPAAPTAPAQTASAHPSVVPATPTPQRSGEAEAAAGGQGSTGLAMGAERAEAIANMEAMGFERSQIEAAMRAAFNNPDRAVEYLLNRADEVTIQGIPENVQQEQRPRSAAAASAPSQAAPTAQGNEEDAAAINLFDLAAQQGGAARGGASAGGNAAAPAAAGQAGDLGNLDFLRHNPQFQQLRQVVQQQPQMLEPILQQLGSGNPQLAQLIASNPDQFLQLLGESADDDVPLPPGAQAISVTEEERDAIERLCRLGFDRNQAIQAYFACDKNEELAANFLFDQPDDDESPTN
ncbi:UV excision repair protein Rad23 [Moelleriella libera RCEF 2490]|uniref:UV excision repair protein RAD23 n=1 Tax=Moelleriella libera RCEF 2490 TaxID=1081109 RepID=A0A166V0V2_9HYPO|nr:UV excision repair protein Rad23 [Moelleriella libera RCEF 2490]